MIMLMICSSHVQAQSDPITIDVEISRSRIYVGDELTYQILIRGTKNPPMPVIEFPSSVRAQYNGRTNQAFTSMQIVNGRNRTVTDRRFSYQYTLTAIDSGYITIPAPTIVINGQQYAGKESSFESLFPAESKTDKLEMVIDRDEIYLNETVVVECAWWIGNQTTDFRFSSSYLPDSLRVLALNPSASGQSQVGFVVFGQKIVGLVDVDQSDPQERSKLVFRFSITPTETGTFDLGPLRAVFTRHTGAGRNYRAYVESESTEIVVRAVPSENQPDDYSGALGAFQLKAQASNSTVNVGDPIQLTLRIMAPEPMIGIDDAPDISADPRFTDRFKISSEGWREVRPRQAGRRVYETTIRALNDRVEEIPPIRLPSFHSPTRSYRFYQTEPIDLVVNPVKELTLSDAIVTGGSSQSQIEPIAERTKLTPAMPGLWAHGTTDEMLANTGFSVADAIRNPGWVTVIASGPTLFAFSILIVVARGSSDPRSRELRKAWHQSKALSKQGIHAQALRIYLAAALEINPDAITAEDARQLSICDDDIELIVKILTDDELGDYIGHDQSESCQSDLRFGFLKDLHLQTKQSGGVQS